MTSKPLVAVISCVREVEGEPASIVKKRYLEAVAKHADAVPIIVPAWSDALAAHAIVERVDAIVLTGSNSNIEPHRYGASGEGTPPFDTARDGLSQHLIHAAIAMSKPVFGVCRGLQEINVAFGGTLADERAGATPAFSHHAADGADLETMFGHSHGASIAPGGLLSRIMGEGELAINSVHFQTVARLGEGLRVEAQASDGVIEALSASDTNAPVLAVQWHPEWRPADREHDLAFWRYLGQAARAAMR